MDLLRGPGVVSPTNRRWTYTRPFPTGVPTMNPPPPPWGNSIGVCVSEEIRAGARRLEYYEPSISSRRDCRPIAERKTLFENLEACIREWI
jgi:hypothetical protein